MIVAVLGFIDIAGRAAAARLAALGVRPGDGSVRRRRRARRAVGRRIAIALSLLNFIRRAWRPHDAVLGRVDNLKGYHDTERHPDAASSRASCSTASTRRSSSPTPTTSVSGSARWRGTGDSSWIVVAAEPITDVDTTAGEMLHALDEELDAAGIELAFAELKDPVRDRLRRYGIEERDRRRPVLPDDRAWQWRRTSHDSGVDWLDWEERKAGRQSSG